MYRKDDWISDLYLKSRLRESQREKRMKDVMKKLEGKELFCEQIKFVKRFFENLETKKGVN